MALHERAGVLNLLTAAFWLLLTAGLIGSVLATMHLRGGRRPHLRYGVVHGLLGSIGFVALLFALRGPPRGAALGVAQFGAMAAVLLAVALLAGVAVFVLRLRRRAPGLLIGIHATVAIGGIVILAAYTLVG